jgi:hypothetical protein
MIEKLGARLVDFPGASNCARCFTHILNLVVKSVMHQFDLHTAKSDAKDERSHELFALAGEIDAKELETQDDKDQEDSDEEVPPQDNDEGWIDERDDMSQEDVDELEDNVRPVCFLLTKVSGAARTT